MDRAALWLFVPLIPVLFAVKVESIAGSFLRITINVIVTTTIIYLLFLDNLFAIALGFMVLFQLIFEQLEKILEVGCNLI